MGRLWTEVSPIGHRHFKSYNYGADKTDPDPVHGFDVPLNARAIKPGLWVAWYNRQPDVVKVLSEWCRAWVKDAMRTDGGKPKGIFPAGVRVKDDSFCLTAACNCLITMASSACPSMALA